jgi:acetate kinase
MRPNPLAAMMAADSTPLPVAGAAVLVLNGGSSSIRFAIFAPGATPARMLTGTLDRIGLPGATLRFTASPGTGAVDGSVPVPDDVSAVVFLLDWLARQPAFALVGAVGHRIVHGMQHTQAQPISAQLLSELRRASPYDPDHLPRELALIEALSKRRPALPQTACFDTAFHHTLPRVATLLAIPRRYEALGVRRYGFHGLSYTFLMEELVRLGEPSASRGRVVLAHLGSGASVAAVRDGRSIDTSMGFTPASGLPMSTRSGDLDPGLAGFLARTEGMTPIGFEQLVNHESGLLGISETSGDMRDLLQREATDERAAEAIALFCYQVRKAIGSMASALGGLDTLVFSGGIGENQPRLRERICAELGFLGVVLDADRNAANEPQISAQGGRVGVRVIRTDEELVIARTVLRSQVSPAPGIGSP